MICRSVNFVESDIVVLIAKKKTFTILKGILMKSNKSYYEACIFVHFGMHLI